MHHGKTRGGLYPLTLFPSSSGSLHALSSARVLLDVWHSRLGHVSYPTVKRLVSQLNLPVSSNKVPTICSACQQGKSHCLPFSTSSSMSSFRLKLLFADVWGPAPTLSFNGYKYYVFIVDHFSKFLWIFPMVNKSDVLSIFLTFQKHVERQFNRQIKSVQMDGGGEFQPFHKHFMQTGIQHRISCPYTSAQNGTVERHHHQIVEVGLSLLSHANVPTSHWDSAFQMATYLINLLSSTSLNPFETLFHNPPDYSLL